jgi:RNA polymerase sigma-70 factor (ECF subfamily)
VNENDFLAERFEEQRGHLHAVAYRMLGSSTEADDAVQEAWRRLSRSESDTIENLGGWLTTVTARVCLNMLRSRQTRREEPLDPHVPDPVVTSEERADPEQQAMLADSVGLALLVVLETLAPAERLAFVLHDMFAVPFDEIATIVERSPDATRQLASRARRRVQGAAVPDPDVHRQREVVDAFFAAARGGDFDALVAVLDPDVVLRADSGASRVRPSEVIRGAHAVASQAVRFARPTTTLRPVLVNGDVGVVAVVNGRPLAVMGFTVAEGRIVAIDALSDPQRLRDLDLSDL